MSKIKIYASKDDHEKAKRRKHLSCHFGDDDIIIGDYRLNAVHYIPAKIPKGLELDFYMDTGDDAYLLRLENKPDNVIIYVNRETTEIIPVTYIIVRKVLLDDIYEELDVIIKKIKAIGYPDVKGEAVYEIENWNR